MMTAIPALMMVQARRAAALATLALGLCFSPLAAQTAAPPAAGAPVATPGAKSPESKVQDTRIPDPRINEVAARPALVFEGQSTWEDGYTSLANGFQRLRAELDRLGLKAGGNTLSVFVSTDDLGFRFQAMAPLEQAPANPPEFGAEFKLGQTPDGRAIKFEHRGSYEEIDATYEAITAWLDEKGLDARDFFVEEFASLGTGPDDSASAVDVYVFVK
jgi:effector-binding domain-containing protein